MFKDFHYNFFPENKIGEKEVAAVFEYVAQDKFIGKRTLIDKVIAYINEEKFKSGNFEGDLINQ